MDAARGARRRSIGRPSWLGPAAHLCWPACCWSIGKLSALFLLPQLGFILALVGHRASRFGGTPLLKVTWLPIVFLLFAIPLPYVVDAGLSLQLQLISSQLGVDFIRLFGIPVYLEGNVIDLGVYKLQVVEACSGLRYLYPLMSLGFLAAYLFQAPLWQRALVFLSTIPITIAMNSLRIGLVGILVDHFGPQDADGFLHMFEGWIIFIACVGAAWRRDDFAGARCLGQGVFRRVPSAGGEYRPLVPAQAGSRAQISPAWIRACAGTNGCGSRSRRSRPAFCCCAQPATAGAVGVDPAGDHPGPQVVRGVPDHTRRMAAAAPPRSIHRPNMVSGSPTTSSLITRRRDGRPVNLYVAYYANQRTGVLAALASPSAFPAMAGSSPTSSARTTPAAIGRVSLPFNRVIIGSGNDKQLVYYWFEERGMKIANEYWSKLFLLRDALLENRTDGALVRLTTPVYPGEAEADADKRLQEFTAHCGAEP